MRSHACTLFGREYIIIELVVLRMLDWSKIYWMQAIKITRKI
ncbi:unknown [Coraliomargarita sp. CAG:312]|nr:unknown [Coraliomargarita sp. CAG:312]